MKLTIRFAKPSDLGMITRGIREIFELEKIKVTPTMMREQSIKARRRIKKKSILAAEDKGKPIAFLIFETQADTPFGVDYGRWTNSFAWVSWSFVDDRYRGKGIGKALYGAMEKTCRKRGIREVMLDVFTVNEKSRAFHRKLGFKPLLSIYSKKIR